MEQTIDRVDGFTCRPMPPARVPIWMGRLRMSYRFLRYLRWSLVNRHLRGVRDAVAALNELSLLSLKDFFGPKTGVECNICGWRGSKFYPNAGSGYSEMNIGCPRCHCIHRYRSLAAILDAKTEFFSQGSSVIEVAPVRGFQAYSLWRKNGSNYISFDLEKFGMEKGDLTAMRFGDNSCEFFVCFHVLEHVPAEDKALREIFRVLRPNGVAILQVPIDYKLTETIEYGFANRFETNHVRRYSEKGFFESLTASGFLVSKVGVHDLFDRETAIKYGLDSEPVYFAQKPG